MKKHALIMSLVMVLGLATLSNATLWDRGGGLIYDDALNVTWLQDANYAKTSGYDAEGQMTWNEATTWASNLAYYDSVRNVTWTDWRLPQTLPVNGSNYNYNFSFSGTTDYGYNISAPGSAYPGSMGSEMAYMFYSNLRNTGVYDINGNPISGHHLPKKTFFESGGPGGSLVSFINLEGTTAWWSGTTYASSENQYMAWNFNFQQGIQDANDKNSWLLYAWAVRDGDVGAPVPIPGAVWLLGSGLIGLMGIRKKLKK